MPHGWNHMFAGAAAIVITLGFIGTATTVFGADWPAHKLGEAALWDGAYDAQTGTRFIPIQLILPSRWSGERRIDHPEVTFTDPGRDFWKGPKAGSDADSGAPIQVYDRSRNTPREGYVSQLFAVRAEQDGLGRVYDSRFGGLRCSGEIKFPLGEWQQGEVRYNEYTCKAGRGMPKKRRNTITIEKIDFPCRGVEHCLQFTWLHEIEGQKEPADHRRYIFAPGLGEIAFDRLK